MKIGTSLMIADAIRGNDALSIDEFTKDMNNFGEETFKPSKVLRTAVEFGRTAVTTKVQVAMSANRPDVATKVLQNSNAKTLVKDLADKFGLNVVVEDEHIQLFNSWMETAERKSKALQVRIQHADSKAAKKASLRAKRAQKKNAQVEELAKEFAISVSEAKKCIKHARRHRISNSKYMELRDLVLKGVEATTAKIYQGWELLWFLASVEKDGEKVSERFMHDLKVLFPKEVIAEPIKKVVSKEVVDTFKTICQHKNGKVIKFTYPAAY